MSRARGWGRRPSPRASSRAVPDAAAYAKFRTAFRKRRIGKGPTVSTDTIDRANGHYTIISADCHAGGSHQQYREYLDQAYLEDFDAWRGKYKNPFKDLGDQRRYRNWDNEMRNSQQEADGVVGEVVFPNTVPPFFPSFVLFAGPPKPEDYEHRLAGHPRPQPLAGRLVQPVPRAAGRHRPDLPQRHRRRHRRRQVDQGAQPAWRPPPPQHPARRHVDEAALRPGLRPAVGGDRGPRDADPRPRRHRCARLRALPGGDADVHQRGRLLLAAPARPVHPLRRLRPVPPAEVRHDRDRRGLGAAAAARASTRSPRRSARPARPARSATARSRSSSAPRRSTSGRTAGWASASPGPDDAKARAEMGEDRFMWGSDYPHDEGTHPSPASTCARCSPASSPARCSGSWPRTRPSSSTSTSPPWRRWPPSSARRSRRSAEPLTELPAEPNEALLQRRREHVRLSRARARRRDAASPR